jgi:hypothetical protein
MIVDSLISWMWRGMMRLSARLLGTERAERFRVTVPYFILCGLRVAFIELPAAAIVLLAQALGYRGTPEVSLTRTWITLGAVPIGFAAAVAVLAGIAYLTGYRPYRHRWQNLEAAHAMRICSLLWTAAQGKGCKRVWTDTATGSFIAVGQLNRLEEMCLSVFNRRNDQGRHDVVLKLESRTAILWGGRAIHDVGQSLVDQLAGCFGEHEITRTERRVD